MTEEVITKVSFTFNCLFCGEIIATSTDAPMGFCSCGATFTLGLDRVAMTRVDVKVSELPELVQAVMKSKRRKKFLGREPK